ncbi:hypothetical protein A3K34_04190 [candidate division WWE3 bacterium RIFOXYC1_FULL_40_10]|uniref:Triosephosphate isomerase n=1 Tax=candidate division WWE3 bacterium RIFOXYA2_FULL_46_9 TaxID=1802636 RepID=A0A1F4W111_UNCKA|nr:MAG: hypothetical protein A3K58_04190 [candidate division WWE3 bacterium RIFOXYB1_FULL_40_22]OGC62041.1 MAG: hypothetical protein A3K37_04190 [candidate division WWE3 bacterium RIFOXYA1_FULL_40_11]OGC62958.1 MAG: hypothetical protein A2264_03705 [candidate division WWE3 bacterium RIFOXYA2_FULL_46_9]OGC65015.1 MAG: hypothetical protein A2326_03180 [candidate division WWE3 bacterium RIFOXYB2_FULL_41_6]OGC66424.1 MAG: hypothetical protein A3K34_04190 [candidate division WWE3 bacterium RIFOXYC1_
MKLITANWKMNMSTEEALEWATRFREIIPKPLVNSKVIVAPSLVHLPLIFEVLYKTGVELAAQDISLFEKGAHTGEVGGFQLRDFCKYCIIGHSERNETTETVLLKRDACLSSGLTPIICFSDNSLVRILSKKGVILARENPQNISVNGVYREDNIEAIERIFSELPKETQVIYGGSVNRQNAPKLAHISGLEGVLVGNASLDPQHFVEIIEIFDK